MQVSYVTKKQPQSKIDSLFIQLLHLQLSTLSDLQIMMQTGEKKV